MRHSQCFFCKHLVITSREEMLKIWRCKAFPEGIPRELRFTHFVHNKPYPGDGGVLFEQDPDNEFKFDIEGAAMEQETFNRHRGELG